MKYFTLILILLSTQALQAQAFKLTVYGLDAKSALLYSLQGENTFLIDSVKSVDGKSFNYTFNTSTHHPGFYRLKFQDNKWVDFIYDGGKENLQTNALNIIDSMKVFTSESNRLYYSFIKLNRQFKLKTDLLQIILARYPKDDDFYKASLNKLSEVQKVYLEFVNITSQKDPQSFISRYIRTSQLPVVDLNLSPEKQLSFLKSSALSKVDFNDSRLIYSDAFTNKTIEYLTYYRNPQLTKAMLEHEFIIAVDSILNRAKVNQMVYQHIVEYLIGGFRKFAMEEVLDYIVNNYVIKDDLCLDTKTEGMIERRINQNKKLPVNSIAPDISMPDSSGRNINLSDLKADKTLVIFYASWCPHCKDLIPQIWKLYKQQNQKRFEVYAISLDTKRNDWMAFTKDHSPDWVNVSDLLGWAGKASSDYYIYATPTIFLLDKNKRIISKPLNIEDLKKSL